MSTINNRKKLDKRDIGVLVVMIVLGTFLVVALSMTPVSEKTDDEDSMKKLGSISQEELDSRVNDILKELEDYGGAMIVTYDPETGEIIDKKPQPPQEAGRLSLTEEEARGQTNLPSNAIIIPNRYSPSQMSSGEI